MSRESVGAAALLKQPLYYSSAQFPELTLEERLGRAYDEAAAALKAVTPQGVAIDASKYELADEVAGKVTDANESLILTSLAAGKDLPADSGYMFTPEQSRQYYLGKFARASANLGAYLTGFMRGQINLGAISQSDFDKGGEARIRLFSEIIHLSRTGALGPVVAGENYGQATIGDAQPRIVVASQGVATDSLKTGAQGFGIPLAVLANPYVAVGVIIVVGIVVVAGVAAYFYSRSDEQKSREQAYNACLEAIRQQNPNAEAICKNMSDIGTNKAGWLDYIIPKDIQNKVVNYALLGAGAYLVIAFSPQIIRALSRAKDTYSEVQAKRLAQMHDDSGLEEIET